MGKKAPITTEEQVQDRLREELGRGDGASFREWLSFRDLSSYGNASRYPNPATGRQHTVFSGIEDDLFCTVEQQPQTLEIQLQRAMEREITLACAKALNIEHPVYDGTNVVAVLSLDAVVKRKRRDGSMHKTAFESKHSSDLKDRRTLEKLSISRLYCGYVGWSHHIVTQETFADQVRTNLAWVRGGARKEREVETPEGLFTVYPKLMLEELRLLKRHVRLFEFTAHFEKRYSLGIGIGLRILKILAWERLVRDQIDGPEIGTTSTKTLIQKRAADPQAN